jgi:hypothetical protein
VEAEFGLRRFEDGERDGGTTEVEQATTVGGDGLVVAGSGAEEVAELVVASAEALRRAEVLEAPHTSDAAFGAPAPCCMDPLSHWKSTIIQNLAIAISA